ncbi:nuclear transport factor 2 family protein [Tsuneonella amylolytica]|uniref:nuclear transport factor 2 family protein n=1 Tax=Tsuneonella amylolytica TaxID=2338327 RepID=UPI0013C49873|nr:nuclear transport factor 2 family protein [Tsuneonella amylolytica]
MIARLLAEKGLLPLGRRRRRLAFARRYVAAFNDRDWVQVERMLAPEFRHIDTVGDVVEGPARYIEASRRLAEIAPDVSIVVDDMAVGRDQLYLRGRLVSAIAKLDEATVWQAEFAGERLRTLRLTRPHNTVPLSRLLAD